MNSISNDQDMHTKIFNLSSEHYIDNIELTKASMEIFFQELNLDVTKKSRSSLVENKRIPSLILIFYYYIYCNKQIPTQEQFIYFYKTKNKKWIQDNLSNYILELEGRLCRTYPSLLRDIHMYISLKESGLF